MAPRASVGWARFLLLAGLFAVISGCTPALLAKGGKKKTPLPPPEEVAYRRFVDGAKASSGNGRGWNRAYRTLEEGLAACAADATISELWLARGIYRPADTAGIDSQFRLVPAVALYGSFVPGQSDPADRDFTVNPSVLDGAIGGGTPSERVCHVVAGAQGAVLDGLVISNGSARGADSISQSGGGLVVSGCAMTLRWCRFDANQAEGDGGGLVVVDGSVVLQDCLFTANRGGHGGGMQAMRSQARLLRCSFIGNEGMDSFSLGGGLATYQATSWIERCHFIDNVTGEHGGGLWIDDGEAFVVASVFQGNQARWGGGTSIYQSQADVANCVFVANRAANLLGGTDINGAGAINSNANTGMRVANCTLVGNTATQVVNGVGGAVIVRQTDDVYGNCIFWGNRVQSSGSLGHVINCVYDATLALHFSWFEGSIAGPWVAGLVSGVSSVAGNSFSFMAPGFVDETDADGMDDLWGTADDGLRLLSTSVGAGSGSPTFIDVLATTPERAAALATDLVGQPRTTAGTISMGAYEDPMPAGSG